MKYIEAEYFHVDAFAEKPFEGNPASICFMSTK
ncbi:phenazine biosynthesis protein, partial [Candidatus Bathyarchaeota archaeon]|nr:phenazine biosynthesis protein [Candidatus Bathyarchaeota archaeon]